MASRSCTFSWLLLAVTVALSQEAVDIALTEEAAPVLRGVNQSCTDMCKYAGAFAGKGYMEECNKGWHYALETAGGAGKCKSICIMREHRGNITVDDPCVIGCRCGKEPPAPELPTPAPSVNKTCTDMCRYAGAWASKGYTEECNKGWHYALETPGGGVGKCESICITREHRNITVDDPCVIGCRCGKDPKEK